MLQFKCGESYKILDYRFFFQILLSNSNSFQMLIFYPKEKSTPSNIVTECFMSLVAPEIQTIALKDCNHK